MRKLLVIGLSTLALTVSGYSLADKKDPNLGAIKARQAEMQLRSFNAGSLFAMAKGDLEYDAEQAAKFANNLKLLLAFDIGHAWAPGTDSESYAGVSRSKPELWETYPKIAEYGKQYAEAVEAVAASSGNGLNELRANIGALGKSCKACHDDFRAKKK